MKIIFLSLLLISNLVGCLAANTKQTVSAEWQPPGNAMEFKDSWFSLREVPTAEVLIWKGRAGKYRLEWDTSDVYVISPSGKRRALFGASFKALHQNAINTVYENMKSISSPTRGLKVVDVGHVTVLSVVGTIVTFQIDWAGWVEGYASTSGEVAWLTIDLARKRNSKLIFDSETNFNPDYSQKIELTRFYSRNEIINGLFDNVEINRQLRDKSKKEQLRIITDVFRASSNALRFGPNRNFALWGINGFAFNRIEGNKIIIRLQLEETASFTREIQYIEIKLPISNKLRYPLVEASSMRSGFLGENVEIISKGIDTQIKFESVLMR